MHKRETRGGERRWVRQERKRKAVRAEARVRVMRVRVRVRGAHLMRIIGPRVGKIMNHCGEQPGKRLHRRHSIATAGVFIVDVVLVVRLLCWDDIRQNSGCRWAACKGHGGGGRCGCGRRCGSSC